MIIYKLAIIEISESIIWLSAILPVAISALFYIFF